MSALAWVEIHSDATQDHSYQQTRLGPLAIDYLDWCKGRNLAERTIDTIERDLARLCHLTHPKPPELITTRDLERVISTWPIGSRRRARAIFRPFFDWLYDDGNGVIITDPARRLPAIKVATQKIIDIFNETECDNLKHLPAELRDRALTTLLLETGLRKAEARALTMADVDLDGRLLSVRKGKGRKGRVVRIPATSARLLADLALTENLDREAHLWYTRHANERTEWVARYSELSSTAFHRWWARMCDEAGVRYRNAHVCRHTYATKLLKAGVPMGSVSRLLGHASVRTTVDIYMHLAIGDLADDVDRVFDEVQAE